MEIAGISNSISPTRELEQKPDKSQTFGQLSAPQTRELGSKLTIFDSSQFQKKRKEQADNLAKAKWEKESEAIRNVSKGREREVRLDLGTVFLHEVPPHQPSRRVVREWEVNLLVKELFEFFL